MKLQFLKISKGVKLKFFEFKKYVTNMKKVTFRMEIDKNKLFNVQKKLTIMLKKEF